IIPPSLPMIMYGIITEENIGALFIAGIVPGVILMIVYILIISQVVCRRDPTKAPPSPRTTWGEKFKSIVGLIPMIVLFILVLGGIYAGWFTTTEAGAIGAFGAILIGFVTKQLNFKKMWECIIDSVKLTGTIAIMLIGTNIFIYFMSMSKIPFFLSNLVTSMNVSPTVVIIVIALVYIVLGMFMPDNPMVVLTIPILYPIVSSLGIDGIWFGIFVVFMMALGSITPPVGMVVYLLSGLTKIPVNKIFKGVLPFIIGMVLVIVLLVIFPDIATFLPGLMAKG
ncbi:MAG: TRAP transporter large permease, partial [Oscillospiraceae bacterium]|nr:TRAP transporter large permease [Oscillospiraceae bacterium]